MTPPRVVLDTNVVISGVLFGGPPRAVLQRTVLGSATAVTSPSLLAELTDVLVKKFRYDPRQATLVAKKYARSAVLVHPRKTVTVLQDDPDNRVLEAAIEGACRQIVTGDQVLLKLKTYRGVTVVRPRAFLSSLE